jgi:hypothetical protein
MPQKNSTYPALLIASIFIGLLAVPGRPAAAEELSAVKAAVKYYADAGGVFTLTPPPAETGYYLPLGGTCACQELMIKIQKKDSGLSSRQIVYRMIGRAEFDMKYLFKDGIGDYEISMFGRKAMNARTYAGLCRFTVSSLKALPERSDALYINDKLLAYVDTVIGKTVNSGECWDLAQEALDRTGADWTRPLYFGRLLDPESDDIKTGDIIQFRAVRLTVKLPGGVTRYEALGNPDHTAVIYGIEGKKIYRLAHQNSDGKRFVIVTRIDLNAMTSGTYWIYRPIAGLLQ